MTEDTMNLRGLLEKTADSDFLREMIGFSAQRSGVDRGGGPRTFPGSLNDDVSATAR